MTMAIITIIIAHTQGLGFLQTTVQKPKLCCETNDTSNHVCATTF